LLANSTDINLELAEVIEETDEILEEYKMNYEDVKIKLLCTIKQLKEKDMQVNELQQEIEMISDENEELNEKLCDKTDDFNRLKREYDKEKIMQVMRERQKAKGLVGQSELKGEIVSNEEVLNEVESLRQEIRLLQKINTKYKAILGPV